MPNICYCMPYHIETICSEWNKFSFYEKIIEIDIRKMECSLLHEHGTNKIPEFPASIKPMIFGKDGA